MANEPDFILISIFVTTLDRVMTLSMVSQLDLRLCWGNTPNTSFSSPRTCRVTVDSPVPATESAHKNSFERFHKTVCCRYLRNNFFALLSKEDSEFSTRYDEWSSDD